MKKLQKQIFLLTILGLFSLNTYSQNQIICQIIDSQTNKPVDSVAVFVHEKDIHTTSNSLGYFSLAADSSDTIILKKTFYETSIVEVPNSTAFKIMLEKRLETEYLGGWEAFRKIIAFNIRYPSEALVNRTTGIVYVSFDIDKNGNMKNIKSLEDIGDGCGDEVIRLLELVPNNWQTTNTTETFTLPIVFKIGNSKIKDKKAHIIKGRLIDEIFVTVNL
uniref:energy transducer TonB n=1 Tax=uncultured Draconibacterium sp. TaxID=1573823 RepID=UPI0032174C87